VCVIEFVGIESSGVKQSEMEKMNVTHHNSMLCNMYTVKMKDMKLLFTECVYININGEIPF